MAQSSSLRGRKIEVRNVGYNVDAAGFRSSTQPTGILYLIPSAYLSPRYLAI